MILSMTLQLLLVAIIMFLIVSKIPKIIQGLLSGNPSMSGSDMTGAVMGTVGTAAAVAGTAYGASAAAAAAKAKGQTGWRMSTMGQFAASMLSKAPVSGSAFGAYTGVMKAYWNEQDRNGQQQENGDSEKETTPISSPEQQNNKTTASGGNRKPSRGRPVTSSPTTKGVASTQHNTSSVFKKFPGSMKKKKTDPNPKNNDTK